MIKRLLPLAVVGIIVWIGYATFFGTDQDKANRDKLMQGLKQTGQAVSDIVATERGKLSAGKYDKSIDLITTTLSNLKSAQKQGADYSRQINELEQTKEDMQKQYQAYQQIQNSGAAQRIAEAPNAPTAKNFEANMQRFKSVLESVPASATQ